MTTSRSKIDKPSKSGRLVVHKEHVCDALTGFLQSLSIIDDDHEVTSFYKVPEGLDVKIEESKYDEVD